MNDVLTILDTIAVFALVALVAWLVARGRKSAAGPAPAPPDLESALLDAIPDGIVFVNDNGVILRANRAATNMFAMPVLEGTVIERLIPDELADRHRKHVQQYFREGAQARPMGIGLPLMGVRAGGQEFPVEIALAPVPGPRRQAVAVIRDMTARRAAERGHP